MLLTFDDGPRNFFDISFPLLARYRAHAIAFIAPGSACERGNDPDTEARPMNWEEIREPFMIPGWSSSSRTRSRVVSCPDGRSRRRWRVAGRISRRRGGASHWRCARTWLVHASCCIEARLPGAQGQSIGVSHVPGYGRSHRGRPGSRHRGLLLGPSAGPLAQSTRGLAVLHQPHERRVPRTAAGKWPHVAWQTRAQSLAPHRVARHWRLRYAR